MAKETIFDLFNAQHASNTVVTQPETLPGIVRPSDVTPETIPGEKNASSSSLAATATTPTAPAAPAAPTAAGGEQENSETSYNNNSNEKGGEST